MDSRIDLERLSQVFTDHPWLAEAVSNGAWWGNLDGTVRLIAPLQDPLELQAGMLALAEALGCEASELGLDPDQSVASRLRPGSQGSPHPARRARRL